MSVRVLGLLLLGLAAACTKPASLESLPLPPLPTSPSTSPSPSPVLHMPALVGKTYTKAKQTLEAMGLRVKKQTRYSSAPGGEVLVQSRKSGSVVSPGLAVTLTVAIAIPPAVNGNPWGYNWACCKTITSPPSEFCSYFVCVRTFWNGTGFVVQCNDDQLSKTGGTGRQTCSGHEGHQRTLYAP